MKSEEPSNLMTTRRLFYTIVIVIILIWLISSSSKGFESAPVYDVQTREVHIYRSGKVIVIQDKFDSTGKGDKTQGVFVKAPFNQSELSQFEAGQITVEFTKVGYISTWLKVLPCALIIVILLFLRRDRTGSTP